jgi:hypothetical protein
VKFRCSPVPRFLDRGAVEFSHPLPILVRNSVPFNLRTVDSEPIDFDKVSFFGDGELQELGCC